MEHNKEVATIIFPGEESITAIDGKTMHTEVSYEGDRNDIYVVVFRDGKEISRHNTKYIESIIWK